MPLLPPHFHRPGILIFSSLLSPNLVVRPPFLSPFQFDANRSSSLFFVKFPSLSYAFKGKRGWIDVFFLFLNRIFVFVYRTRRDLNVYGDGERVLEKMNFFWISFDRGGNNNNKKEYVYIYKNHGGTKHTMQRRRNVVGMIPIYLMIL